MAAPSTSLMGWMRNEIMNRPGGVYQNLFMTDYGPKVQDLIQNQRMPADDAWDEAIVDFFQDHTSQFHEQFLGKPLSRGELKSLINKAGVDYTTAVQNLKGASPDTFKGILSSLRQSDEGKDILRNHIRDSVTAAAQSSFGDRNLSDKVMSNEEIDNLLSAADPEGWASGIQDKVTEVNNNRLATLESVFGSEFMAKTGRPPNDEEIDNFIANHSNDSLGLESLGEKDYTAIRESLSSITESVSQEVAQDPAVAQEAQTTDLAGTPFSLAEIESKKKTALDTLAKQLEQGVAQREETLRGALGQYVQEVSGQPEQLRGILEERFERKAAELPRALGEEFTAGVGLKTGAFQRAMAEELAAGRTDIESRLAEFELGQQQDIAQRRLALEEGIAGVREADVRRLGELETQIGFQGAQLGREDFLNTLQFQQQQQLMSQQQDINLYLNRLGFMQNQAAVAAQFQQQQQLLGQQQAFGAEQAGLERALSERMYNRQLQEQRQAERAGRKRQTQAAYGQLAGLGLGAATGGLLAGGLAGGLTAGQGALLGGGIFGGQPGLTYAAFQR